MPIPIVSLDTWSFRDLVKEGTNMLPSLAPEWTNYNASDPGITLIELFAYFTEILLFQTSQITRRDLEAFHFLLEGATFQHSEHQDLDKALGESIFRLRQPSRAVTCADFEYFALKADPRVARAKAIPRINLAERNQEARSAVRPGHLSVVVLPHADPGSDEEGEVVKGVAAYLAPRRLLTTRVHVIAPRYIDFEINLRVVASPGVASEVAVNEAIEELKRLLDAFRGGFDRNGWPFGRDIFVSDIYRAVSMLPDTDHVSRGIDTSTGREVEEIVIRKDGLQRIRRNQDGELVSLYLSPDELPGALTLNITADSTTANRTREI